MVGGPPTPRDRLCAAAAKTPRSVAASCTHGSQHTLMIMPYTNLPLFLSLYPSYDLWLVICLSVHSRVITLLPPPAPTRPLINSTIPINSVHILIWARLFAHVRACVRLFSVGYYYFVFGGTKPVIIYYILLLCIDWVIYCSQCKFLSIK